MSPSEWLLQQRVVPAEPAGPWGRKGTLPHLTACAAPQHDTHTQSTPSSSGCLQPVTKAHESQGPAPPFRALLLVWLPETSVVRRPSSSGGNGGGSDTSCRTQIIGLGERQPQLFPGRGYPSFRLPTHMSLPPLPLPTMCTHIHPPTHLHPSLQAQIYPSNHSLAYQLFHAPVHPPIHLPSPIHLCLSVCLSTSQPSVYSTHPHSCFFHQSSDPSVLESGAQELVPAFPRNTGRSPCPGGSRYSGAFRGGNGKMGKFSLRLS